MTQIPEDTKKLILKILGEDQKVPDAKSFEDELRTLNPKIVLSEQNIREARAFSNGELTGANHLRRATKKALGL